MPGIMNINNNKLVTVVKYITKLLIIYSHSVTTYLQVIDLTIRFKESAYSLFEVYFTLDYLGVELIPSSKKSLI